MERERERERVRARVCSGGWVCVCVCFCVCVCLCVCMFVGFCVFCVSVLLSARVHAQVLVTIIQGHGDRRELEGSPPQIRAKPGLCWNPQIYPPVQ